MIVIERKCRKMVFSKQPLVLVLAQLRFSPVANMAGYIAAIQENFRKAGFPLYSIKEGFGLEISAEGVKQNKRNQWFFETADHRTSFLVDTAQVVFQTIAYQSFEHFIGQFLDLTTRVLEITEQSRFGVLQRLGLRYINAVRGDAWRQFLQPSFHGAPSPLFDQNAQLFSQTTMGLVHLPDGRDSMFGLRLHQNNVGYSLPPDLMAFASEGTQNLTSGGLTTIVDLDHYWEGAAGPGVSVQDLATTFSALHDTIIEVLHESVITKEAIQRWI